MINWIRENRTTSVLAALIPVAGLSLGAMQGCSVDSLIKHDVPPGMRDANGGQAKVSLRDSPYVRDAFVDDVERELLRYDVAAEEAAILRDIIASAVNLGLDQVSESPFPGGVALLGLLGTLAGVFAPQPGAASRLRQEKEDSFNAGLKRAGEIGGGS